ncbi:DUF2914 domain-containing protein [Patescibacteria group bacterium]
MLKEKIQKLYIKYERYVSPIAFFSGFVWDSLTLKRIDLLYENIVFFVYLSVAATSIVLISTTQKYARVMPLVLQFTFGGLFSAFFIFYSRSGSIMTSWFFLLALAILLIGNERFRKRYARLVFQLNIFFIALFSYSIFAVPVFIGKMGAWTFLISGLVSLILVGFFMRLLKQFKRPLIFSILGIYLIFNLLYFTNIIPPIPLSLKEIGIYHFVERNNGQYSVQFEPAPWYLFFKDFNSDFHWVKNTPVYAYSAVFAPTKLNTTIFHRWSYFDEEKDDWVKKSQLGFSISGGRDGGYRGYTMKTSMESGKWRVDVITSRGQVLGRTKFEIVEVGSLPKLESMIY